MSALHEFVDAICKAGLEPAKAIELDDGKLVRFRVAGDKAGSKNGWAVFHERPSPFGAFGSWRTGESQTWGMALEPWATREQRVQRFAQKQAIRRARDAEQLEVHAAVRKRADRLWATARPAPTAHAYLQAKQALPYGIRQLREMLVIPARDAEGTLHTLQFIGTDGAMRFLTGGRIAGCYHSIGRPQGRLLLAEEFATGATLYQATGSATAVCFDCDNLQHVAVALRNKFPRLQLVICADDDRATPGNPGVTRAIAAAKAVGGLLALPRFEAV
jgi:putative DNA primase/helicase